MSGLSNPTVSNDIAFPRGGSSGLTPLEVKEISNEVTKDVLFETSSGTKRKTTSNNSHKRKKVKKDKVENEQDDVKHVRVENFTFKNLIPGTLVLGKIKSIGRLDLTIAIGDNLVGYVPITSTSEEIRNQVETFAKQEENDDIEEEDDDDKNVIITGTMQSKAFPTLSDIFQVGQYLDAQVSESEDHKKRIQLTIEPQVLNKNLEEEDFISGNIIQGSVRSIEDHGVILNIGKPINGFISNKDLKRLKLSPVVGQVLLTTILNKDARVLTLKPIDGSKNTIKTISSVDAIRPGIIVDALVSEIIKTGIITRVFGLVDGTINLSNTNELDFKTLQHKYGVGNNIKARVAAVLLKGGTKKLMLSLLPQITSLPNITETTETALEAFPIGYKLDSTTIKAIDSNYFYFQINGDIIGQAHLSKIDSSKNFEVEYSVGTSHSSRVIGYNTYENILILTMDPKDINAKYLNARDIPSGELVEVEIVKVLPEQKGINVKLNEFNGFVPSIHMSDVKLIYPERKFKVGTKVKARVLKQNGGRLFITLKKSLVNIEDEEVLNSFDKVTVGLKTPGTVEKFVHNGVIILFFNNLSAFLPKNEISETFVNNAKDFLKIGQSVNVRIMNIKEDKFVVTLKQSSDLNENSFDELSIGKTLVEASIIEKAKESVVIELENKVKGVVFNGHLSDGNYEQNRVVYKNLHVGDKLNVLVLEKDLKNKSIIATCKQSLIEASRKQAFPVTFKDIKLDDKIIYGYIRSVTNMGLFISFGGKLTGLVLAKYASNGGDLAKKFYKYQSIICKVLRIDDENKRFLLSLKDINDNNDAAINPIDDKIKFITDYQPGLQTEAIIKAVKGTQLNVQLADNVQGRIDITQCFSLYKNIKDTHQPLSQFHKNDRVKVKVIGFHDSKNHKFLPITHRKSNKNLIVELSIIPSVLEFSDLKVDDEVLAFVNNISRGVVWVSLSPNIKGRISFMELTDDVDVFNDMDNRIPIGTAIKGVIKTINSDHNVVTIVSRKSVIKSFDEIKIGNKYPARILKVKDTYVLVELAEKIVASSFITDALNDYTTKLEHIFEPNDYTTASVISLDKESQKVAVSLRNDDAQDKLINTYQDLSRGDIVKGFIKNIADNGVYVSLGRSVHALVKISDLSDSYLKDWKKYFKPHQLVIGKISSCEAEGQVRMTLKESEINGELKSFKKFDDLQIGDIYEGSVKTVTAFGVFVKLDETLNISGLCHRSEISDNVIEDLTKLFGEGDRVKVKVLKIDREKKRLSLGMKASYFSESSIESDENENEPMDEEEDEVNSQSEDSEDDPSDMEVDDEEDEIIEVDPQDTEELSDSDSGYEQKSNEGALSTGGFDWTASILDQAEDSDSSDEEEEFTKKKKRSKGKKYVEDKTADINSRAPQSINDFERLIIGNPNSSILWMNYMSFQLQLSEVEKAREIGERALKTINYNDEQEKLNIWIALLNLENSFGTEESLEETFKKACQFMDSLTMHQKLASIFIISENFEKVDELYKKIFKKFGSESVQVWVAYASNLLSRNLKEQCHEILARALKVLPKRDHIEVVKRFAQLEYEQGELEQGRSLFEGLISDAPKRIDLWNIYIDKEIKFGKDKEKVEDLFERVITKKLSKKQAKFFFNKWVEYEDSLNDELGSLRVKAKAADYVEKMGF